MIGFVTWPPYNSTKIIIKVPSDKANHEICYNHCMLFKELKVFLLLGLS